jgi:MinD-like ATPase involved in chromosome partitioning or flagellar assembly
VGSVVTFYSYKGGVGRSMALANVALLLSRRNKRVLVVDWDLEAPGIERYFLGHFEIRQRGDGLLSLLAAGGDPPDGYLDHSWEIVVPGGAPLSLIQSGRDADPDRYLKRLESLDWPEFFASGGGERLEGLRQAWKRDFDVVLIDSRTGLSDSGGICTIQLPDVVVALFAPNDQGMLGTRDVMRYAVHARQKLAHSRMALTVVPVPARIPVGTLPEPAHRWADRAGYEFAEFYDDWLPTGYDPADVVRRLSIPQLDHLGFGEPLPVADEGADDPDGIGVAYNTIASVLADDFGDPRAVLGLDVAPERAPVTSSGRDYVWDIYVSSPSTSSVNKFTEEFVVPVLRDWLSALLAHPPRIFHEAREVPLGQSWPEALRDALGRAKLLVPLLTPAYFSSTWNIAEWFTFEAREKLVKRPGEPIEPLILPVVLMNGDIFPNYAQARQWLNLSGLFNPYMVKGSKSERRLAGEIRIIAEDVVQRLDRVPPWSPDFPIVDPQESTLRPASQPSLPQF